MAVCLDIAKALDTVNHTQLMDALEDLRIRGKPHDLLSNYLYDRTQVIGIENTLSQELYLKYGISQGTVLRPLLFSVSVNNLLTLDL